MIPTYDFLVIGGGAAGFFAAINAAESSPELRIGILERGKEVLTKVKVSGGGRCNVTHAEFDPSELIKNYPRGEKELLGPFHNFMTGDTVAWFEDRGISLKIEADGRMFPESDSSQTIIDCFISEIERLGIDVLMGQAVKSVKKERDYWSVWTKDGAFTAEKLLMATGSNPKIWALLEKMGHRIIPPVPSLFTFNITDERIEGLAGISSLAEVKVLSEEGKKVLESEGPLLITHWGMSGPAILKLSAWGARLLAPFNYRFQIRVNWVGDKDLSQVVDELKALKVELSKQRVNKRPQFELPKRLWRRLTAAAGIADDLQWAGLTKVQNLALADQLCDGLFTVHGKSTFKEEFVTAGGIALNEVNFKTFESKLHRGLYFAGEILNIDAVTGGFNFQNAWTGGFIVARAIAEA